jgi:D-alanyl-D-alanine dipeptidase
MMRRHRILFRWITVAGFLALWLPVDARAADAPGALPEGFVYLDKAIPGIQIELRYSTDHNFVGKPIDGYLKPRAILTRPAARALAEVQEKLKPFGLGLKVFDAYRPQRAVNHFIRWASDLDDTKMKAEFYPDVAKKDLFKKDYIADRSSHSRGSTVDITVVSLTGKKQELNMGSRFDFFGRQSWPAFARLTPDQRANRMLLRTLMITHGFNPYPQEWWHFTLAKEPFPDTYFDFPVR